MQIVKNWPKTTPYVVNGVASAAQAVRSMKRIPLLLPPEMIAWLEAKTAGIENRQTFIRRLLAEAMKSDEQAKD